MEKEKLVEELEQAIFNAIADYHDVFTQEEMEYIIAKVVTIAFRDFY